MKRDKITVTRRFEWDAAHRLFGHEGACASLHGHRYSAEVEITGNDLDDLGRLIDFGEIKRLIGSWIQDNWDHTTIVHHKDSALVEFCLTEHSRGQRKPYLLSKPPTAEAMAKELFVKVSAILSDVDGLDLWPSRVTLWETPNCFATYTHQ